MSLPFLAGYVLGEHGRRSARLAAQAGARSGPSNDDLFGIEDRVERLILIVAAMWSLLEEQGLSEEQLHERIRALDEADGDDAVLVTGSLYTAGAARSVLTRHLT